MTDEILDRLSRIEALQSALKQMLEGLLGGHHQREYYSTAEVAELLGKSEFTVREWARNGRVHATKKETGYGRSKLWSINKDKLKRIQDEGLLPPKRFHASID